jgi:hypothetical protein
MSKMIKVKAHNKKIRVILDSREGKIIITKNLNKNLWKRRKSQIIPINLQMNTVSKQEQ